MSEEIAPKAVVENCVLLPDPDEVTPGIKITVYQVEARMLVPAHKYSNDIYMVKIIKPEGLGYLVDEKGALMDHGRFSFDSTEEVPKGTELEIRISPILSERQRKILEILENQSQPLELETIQKAFGSFPPYVFIEDWKTLFDNHLVVDCGGPITATNDNITGTGKITEHGLKELQRSRS